MSPYTSLYLPIPPYTSGERNNLIIWNQNQGYRASSEYVNKQPYHKARADVGEI